MNVVRNPGLDEDGRVSDPYWVGYFAATVKRAVLDLEAGNSNLALNQLIRTLDRYETAKLDAREAA